MWWAFAAAGATGVLLGLWFRVAALVAVSVVTTIACLPVAVLAGVGLMPSLIITFATVGLLQAGYLAGVMWRAPSREVMLQLVGGLGCTRLTGSQVRSLILRTATTLLASSARSSHTDQRRT